MISKRPNLQEERRRVAAEVLQTSPSEDLAFRELEKKLKAPYVKVADQKHFGAHPTRFKDIDKKSSKSEVRQMQEDVNKARNDIAIIALVFSHLLDSTRRRGKP